MRSDEECELFLMTIVSTVITIFTMLFYYFMVPHDINVFLRDIYLFGLAMGVINVLVWIITVEMWIREDKK